MSTQKLPKTEDMYSFLMIKSFLVAQKALFPQKHYAVLDPKDRVAEIMKAAEKTWADKLKKYKKPQQQNMRNAAMRMILKNSRADYDNFVKEGIQKLSIREVDEASTSDWLHAINSGYIEFYEDLPRIMTDMTSYEWVRATITVAEGQDLAYFDVVIPAERASDAIYQEPVDYESVWIARGGEKLSLNNYLMGEIRSHNLIVLGSAAADYPLAQNSVKLHPSYIASLPSMSLPLTRSDMDLMRRLANFFPAAQDELALLDDFDADNDGNEYFRIYSKLEAKLKERVEAVYGTLSGRREAALPLGGIDPKSKMCRFKVQSDAERENLEIKLHDFKEEKLPDVEIYLVK